MAASIRPTRTEVSRSFPVLGFTVDTGTGPTWFEVALATDPKLFAPSQKAHRTPSNFYSTRALGALATERGEAVWLVPNAVLSHFAGSPRLHYAVATFPGRDRSHPTVQVPGPASPFVVLSGSFSGASRRQVIGSGAAGVAGSGYGEPAPSLEWAGDQAVAGVTEPAHAPGAPALVGAGAPVPPTSVDGHPAAASLAYDDGYGLDFWAAVEDDVRPPAPEDEHSLAWGDPHALADEPGPDPTAIALDAAPTDAGDRIDDPDEPAHAASLAEPDERLDDPDAPAVASSLAEPDDRIDDPDAPAAQGLGFALEDVPGPDPTAIALDDVPPVEETLGGQSFDFEWSDLQLIPQPTTMSCWAASAAMVYGWEHGMSIDPATVAQAVPNMDVTKGLHPFHVGDLVTEWKLKAHPPQSYSIDGFRRLLEANGPLWLGVADPSLHAIVAYGMYGDGTPGGTKVRIADPWPPGRGEFAELTYAQLAQQYENVVPHLGPLGIQILSPQATGHAHLIAGGARHGNVTGPAQAAAHSLDVPSAPPGAMPPPAAPPSAVTCTTSTLEGATFHLDQLTVQRGAGGGTSLRDTVSIRGPKVPDPGGAIHADLDVHWAHDGTGIGPIEIVPTGCWTPPGWTIDVVARIEEDGHGHSHEVLPGGHPCAAVRVEITWSFHHQGAAHAATTSLHLAGDGSQSRRNHW